MQSDDDTRDGIGPVGLFLRFELGGDGKVASGCGRSAWLLESCGKDSDKRFLDIVAEQYRPAVEEALQSLAGGESAMAGFRCRIDGPDGTPLAIEAEAVSRDGAVLVTACDITLLAREQDELRRVLDESSQGFIVHRGGVPLFINPEIARMANVESAEAMLAQPSVLGFIHPDDREFVTANIQARMAGEEVPDNYEFRIVTSDGAAAWVDCRATLIDWDGKPALLAALYDIDDKKRAEIVHQRTEQLFTKVFETSPDTIALTRLEDGRFINANDRFFVGFGYSREEVFGKTVADLDIWAEDGFRDKLTERLKNEGGSVAELETKVRKRNGEIVDVSFSAEVITFEDDVLLLTVGRNITGKKQAEETLRVAKDQAEQASRMKSSFLATMSHEIRTPLNGVLGMVQLLLGTSLDERQRSFAETISSSGTLLLTVLNDILDFSKLEAGKLEIAPAPFDLRQMAAGVTDLMTGRAIEKNIRLELEIAADAPNRLIGDPVRLRQILFNLISNAIKFTDHGHVLLRIERAAEDGGGRRFRFAVNDTGKGIRQEAQAELFNEFTQVDGGRGGSGLGLAICRKLVEVMGGEIGMSSVLGHGSVFWFEVPLGEEGASSGAVERPLDGLAETAVSGEPGSGAVASTLRILVAEDDPVNQLVAKELLIQSGHRVTVVENGRAALEAVGAGTFDLVLMDMQMPELDGLEATVAIRELPDSGTSAIPIIALTASAMQDDVRRCREAGMNGVVHKPVSQNVLFGEIARVMGHGSAMEPDRFPAVGTAPAGLVHRATLEEVRDRIGTVKFMELVEIGQRTIPADMDEFGEAVRNGDLAGMERLAHRLSGAAGLVGLTELRGEFIAIETQLRMDGTRMPDVDYDEVDSLLKASLNSLWVIAAEFSASG